MLLLPWRRVHRSEGGDLPFQDLRCDRCDVASSNLRGMIAVSTGRAASGSCVAIATPATEGAVSTGLIQANAVRIQVGQHTAASPTYAPRISGPQPMVRGRVAAYGGGG